MIFKNKLKTAIVTGSTKGVGQEIAKMFLKNNYNVIITGRNEKTAKNIAEMLNASKNNGLAKGYYLNYNDMNNSHKLLNLLENKEIKINFLCFLTCIFKSSLNHELPLGIGNFCVSLVYIRPEHVQLIVIKVLDASIVQLLHVRRDGRVLAFV